MSRRKIKDCKLHVRLENRGKAGAKTLSCAVCGVKARSFGRGKQGVDLCLRFLVLHTHNCGLSSLELFHRIFRHAQSRCRHAEKLWVEMLADNLLRASGGNHEEG